MAELTDREIVYGNNKKIKSGDRIVFDGDDVLVKWSSANVNYVKIYLVELPPSGPPIPLLLTTSNQASNSEPGGISSWTWNVSVGVDKNTSPYNYYKIRIQDALTDEVFSESNTFKISVSKSSIIPAQYS